MPQSVTVRLAIAFLRAEGIEPTKERIQQKRDEILEKKMRLRTSLTPEDRMEEDGKVQPAIHINPAPPGSTFEDALRCRDELEKWKFTARQSTDKARANGERQPLYISQILIFQAIDTQLNFNKAHFSTRLCLYQLEEIVSVGKTLGYLERLYLDAIKEAEETPDIFQARNFFIQRWKNGPAWYREPFDVAKASRRELLAKLHILREQREKGADVEAMINRIKEVVGLSEPPPPGSPFCNAFPHTALSEPHLPESPKLARRKPEPFKPAAPMSAAPRPETPGHTRKQRVQRSQRFRQQMKKKVDEAMHRSGVHEVEHLFGELSIGSKRPRNPSPDLQDITMSDAPSKRSRLSPSEPSRLFNPHGSV